MNKKSSLRRFLANIYGFSFFNSLLMLAPVYSIFFQEHGMSDMQLSYLFIIFSAGIFITQIPCAWLMGIIGAKNSIILGQVFKAGAFVLWIFFPSFAGFALGQLMWGIQGAIYNVAFEGMLYDELKARHHHNLYAKALGIRENISSVGSILSAAGSLLLFFGYGFITALSVLTLAISTIFIMRIQLHQKPSRKPKAKKCKDNFFKIFATGSKIVRQTPCIFLMMLLSVLVGNFSYMNDYLSVIGVDIGLRKEFIGIVPFFIKGCQMFGQYFAHRLKGLRDWALYTGVAIAGSLFVAFSIFYSLPGLFLFGAAYAMFSAVDILMYSRFQDFVPSKFRSVVLSLYSLADQIMYMGACFVIGLGGNMGSWRYSALFLGMICILIGLWAIVYVKDRCAIEQNPNIQVIKTRKSTSSVSPSKF